MSDLSNLLGDVYGDHSSPDAAPVRHEPAAAERVDLGAGLTAPMSVPAPMPMVDLSVAEAPSWTSAPAPAPSISVSAPVPAMAGGSFWAAGDDDIFPSSKGKKK